VSSNSSGIPMVVASLKFLWTLRVLYAKYTPHAVMTPCLKKIKNETVGDVDEQTMLALRCTHEREYHGKCDVDCYQPMKKQRNVPTIFQRFAESNAHHHHRSLSSSLSSSSDHPLPLTYPKNATESISIPVARNGLVKWENRIKATSNDAMTATMPNS
jgi:hypothetical protein